MKTTLSLITLFLLSACSGDDKTDDSAGETGDSAATGFNVEGTALGLLSGAAATEGLCVDVADPTAAIAGEEVEILASSTVGADGAYAVTGVETESVLGLLVVVVDCAGSGPTVLPTATGIKYAEYKDLQGGATISDFTIYSIDGASQTAFQAGLASAGYTGDLSVDGALVGFVIDEAGAGIAGATVGSSLSDTTYYMAADYSFNTTGTSAETRGLFIIPDAPISTYEATAAGYTFESVLSGSQPGYAVLSRFIGVAE